MGKHCGYQGDSIAGRLSRAIIPDQPLGVDISECCRLHDRGWSEEANKQADLRLKKGIEYKFKARNKPYLGKLVGFIYYIGVRIGGVPVKINYIIQRIMNNDT